MTPLSHLPSLSHCCPSPHSQPPWQTWSDSADLDNRWACVPHWGRPLQADGLTYYSGHTAVSAAHQQPAARGAVAAAAVASDWEEEHYIHTILPHPHPVTSDMADPSLTSPSQTPLRSPNAPLTLSFPFLREGSRVWEERAEQGLPRDLPSPLPTKRTRTYSA